MISKSLNFKKQNSLFALAGLLLIGVGCGKIEDGKKEGETAKVVTKVAFTCSVESKLPGDLCQDKETDGKPVIVELRPKAKDGKAGEILVKEWKGVKCDPNIGENARVRGCEAEIKIDSLQFFPKREDEQKALAQYDLYIHVDMNQDGILNSGDMQYRGVDNLGVLTEKAATITVYGNVSSLDLTGTAAVGVNAGKDQAGWAVK